MVAVLNVGGAPPDEYVSIDEALDFLSDSFVTAKQADIEALDADDNNRLNTGFEVNTGNSASPVVLEFEQFLISIRLGGEIKLADVFRMYGVFIFEVDNEGLRAFVAAGLQIGTDIGSGDPDEQIFNMSALGALVITGDGIAADIDVSVSLGGVLSDFIALDVSARMTFNSTGQQQSITIPA